MQKESPFRLMNQMFLGLIISFAYSAVGAALLFLLEGKSEALMFLRHYNVDFKTLLSLGLILGTAMIVHGSQKVIPRTIEKAFFEDQLSIEYFEYKRRFLSRRRSIAFAAEFAAIGLLIFLLCGFPLPGWAKALMIIPACAQYAFGVYVGRKLFYAAMMLHSLLETTVPRNLFKSRELDDINTYVHIVSTLTIIFGYAHLLAYNEGPFLFDSPLGDSVKIFLMVPALIGTPVLLIFNFYPRIVLRQLYRQSIDFEVENLQKALHGDTLSSFEKKSYLLEFERMSQDELRYSLQLTLSDLPIGITIIVMVAETFFGK